MNTGLFLTKDNVVAGMAVAIAVVGKDEPEHAPDGTILTGRILISTFGPSTVFVPADGHKKLRDIYGDGVLVPKGQKCGEIHSVDKYPLSSVPSTTRFMPLDVFRVGVDAPPPERKFVILVGDQLLCKRHGREEVVPCRTDKDGKLLNDDGYDRANYGRPYAPPAGAVLVPIG